MSSSVCPEGEARLKSDRLLAVGKGARGLEELEIGWGFEGIRVGEALTLGILLPPLIFLVVLPPCRYPWGIA